MEEIDAQPINNVKTTSKGNALAKFVYSIFVAFAVVFVFATFFGQIVFFPMQVKGTSMQPNFNAYAVGETDHYDNVYLGSFRNVSRGDVIVFDATNYTKVKPEEKYFIKRAVGLPGDTIYFAASGTEKNGKIYYDIFVNGVKLEEEYIKEPMYFDVLYHSEEDLAFYTNYVLASSQIRLGNGQYYLLGDNRNHSTDSRFLGPISKSDFYGKVYLQIRYGETLFEAIIKKIF